MCAAGISAVVVEDVDVDVELDVDVDVEVEVVDELVVDEVVETTLTLKRKRLMSM